MANKKDFATGVVASLSGTTLTFQTGYGATMPTPPFYLTLSPPGQLTTLGNSEKVLVNSKTSAEVFEVTRAQGGTSSQSVSNGWIAVNSIYTDDLFSSSIVIGEVLTGTPNGVLTSFTTASAFSSIEVFVNGVRKRGGAGNDYTTSNGNTVTFASAPATGSVIIANYIMGSSIMINGSNGLIAKQAAIGSVNGSNTSFSVSSGSYIGGSLQVFVNGLRQAVSHVTETSPSTGTFSLDTAPLTGDNVEVSYQFILSVSGNADTVDGIHASTTPTANQLLPLDSNTKIPLSVLLNGMTSVQSYTNTGDGAGTGYYINLGGIKICWGTTGNITISGTGIKNISMPSSFFSTIQSAQFGFWGGSVFSAQIDGGAPSTTTFPIYFSSGTGSVRLTWFVIGA